MNEFEFKQRQMRALLAEKNLDALWLQRVSSFAWATCGGAAYINTASTTGAASLLITPTARYLITNNIEAKRLEQEQGLGAQSWEFRVAPWHAANPAIGELTRGLRLGSDFPAPNAIDLTSEIARLRANLTPEEGARFRALGKICAAAMDAAIRAVRPGQTEFEIAARLGAETQARGAQPIVNLIATDERIFAYRHPLPTEKKLAKYAMLVLCGRKWGLVCSITRLVHFGKLPDEIRRKVEACTRIDATFIAATRPGAKLRDVFQRAVNEYAATGFADEWHLHHQGGAAAYEPREYLGALNSNDVVAAGQAYAWNPSITGVKSEDTILVGESRNEIVTAIPGWETTRVAIGDQVIERPVILEQ
ncbi:MAG: M24 family metallopeptidase [Chloroflexi bacterium]|nr:M24 family metallopeptidase [Chloroflexota bacterium]